MAEAYERVPCWPLFVGTTLLSGDRAPAELTHNPGSRLSTTCSAVDAVTVPYGVGLETMVLLGRRDMGPVPCLISHQDQATLLVRAGTDRTFAGIENIQVKSGTGGRLLTHPPRTILELVVHGPSQVFAWDITRLPGPAKSVWFHA
ncbi:hypothetical protein ACFYYY_22280 [Streptomyces sp. NPDC001834]|uniref:hypothetical protein n=1 Tax=Streptomyces sp. NPDC001834 TaxID=3364616 RepID=UPI0036C3AC72